MMTFLQFYSDDFQIDIRHSYTLSMSYMGQPIWDTRQIWTWDMGQYLHGQEKLRDRDDFENHRSHKNYHRLDNSDHS